MKNIILASNSPRRKEILEKYNFKFEIKTSDSDEINYPKFSEDNVKSNSKNKAYSVAKNLTQNSLIIAADTVVVLNSVCLVKPQSFYEALFMLKKLSSNTHKVITSHTILDTETDKEITELSTSYVRFRKLSIFEIIKYIIQKNPLDKAGSYGIQDFINEDNYKNPPHESFIEEISGSYYNIMGLDIELVQKMLLNFWIALFLCV